MRKQQFKVQFRYKLNVDNKVDPGSMRSNVNQYTHIRYDSVKIAEHMWLQSFLACLIEESNKVLLIIIVIGVLGAGLNVFDEFIGVDEIGICVTETTTEIELALNELVAYLVNGN